MATNRFVCDIFNKGFQRDQNLQLHRRGHDLPWKLRQRASDEVSRKRVYVCPEPSCVHHSPGRALGDLTGIKKHFSRKHGEKKWKCDKCSKKYAVQSDWKTHQKTCGTREYKCDCDTIFSRAFYDALSEENNRVNSAASLNIHSNTASELNTMVAQEIVAVPFKSTSPSTRTWGGMSTNSSALLGGPKGLPPPLPPSSPVSESAHASATALLQKAAQMGAAASSNSNNSAMAPRGYVTSMAGPDYHPEHNLVVGISGGAGFSNLLLQRGPQEPQSFDSVFYNGSSLNDMEMLSRMVMGGSEMTRVQDFLGVGEPTPMPPNLQGAWSWLEATIVSLSDWDSLYMLRLD